MISPQRNRIEKAHDKFYKEFEEGADEWSETFEHGYHFAIGLLDCDAASQVLTEKVIQWLEVSAQMKRED